MEVFGISPVETDGAGEKFRASSNEGSREDTVCLAADMGAGTAWSFDPDNGRGFPSLPIPLPGTSKKIFPSHDDVRGLFPLWDPRPIIPTVDLETGLGVGRLKGGLYKLPVVLRPETTSSITSGVRKPYELPGSVSCKPCNFVEGKRVSLQAPGAAIRSFRTASGEVKPSRNKELRRLRR